MVETRFGCTLAIFAFLTREVKFWSKIVICESDKKMGHVYSPGRWKNIFKIYGINLETRREF